jgi:tRNA-guanine family transglycosylase
MTAATLISHHNLYFYASLMRASRTAILEGRFEAFSKEMIERLAQIDADAV